MNDQNEKFNFPRREEEILEFWEKNKIFEKSIQQRERGKEFIFYEGPPTANGRPGIHHVEARVFKDLIPRYKAMRGFRAERRAGWDTHGLPVELEVEKMLKLKSKKDIESYGIANFNKKCKESVWKYKEEWEKVTKRIGFWIDLNNPYITYESDYIETLWWIIKQAHEKDLIYKGYKIVPQCPRCETALSSHEVAQGYESVTEDSVYVKFKIRNKENEYFLAWTTTPWTLPGNVALAINPDIEYLSVKYEFDMHEADDVDSSRMIKPGTYILSKDSLLRSKAFDLLLEESSRRWLQTGGGEKPDNFEIIKGKSLVGLEYEPLFPGIVKETDDNFRNAFKIYPADFVSTENGTGIVHIAPMYGLEDYELGEKFNLPKIHIVNLDGTFNQRIAKWRGKFVKDADKEIIVDLEERNILYKTEPYTHDYPFCWRCHAPLIYYAKDSWYFKMSRLKDDLMKSNQEINWVPFHIKEGRFGEWLKGVKDWAISRERYWGTPIPVWKCEKCGKMEAVGLIDEIKEKSEKSGNKYFVIRHGEAEHNQKQEVSSKIENSAKYPLTEKGKKQIAETIRRLEDKEIDLIFASDFLRTKDTAKMVAEGLGLKEDDIFYDERIREINVGVFDGQKPENYHNYFFSAEEKFYKNPDDGENLNEVKKRMGNFLEDIDGKIQNKNILIVSHEYPIWMLFAAAKALNEKQSLKLRGNNEDFIKTAEVMELDFARLPHDENFVLDLHRPYVDEIVLRCGCGGRMKRIPEIMDVWFDSGAMPFAQAHYPFTFARSQILDFRSQKLGKLKYPADYICEAIDQTRGWFYTLLAVAALLGKGAPYKNVICLGHILDKNGQKMSKHIGNVVDPWEMVNKYGADTVRWYMYTANTAGEPICFDEQELKRSGKIFNTFLNVLAFYKMFAPEKIDDSQEVDLINVLDKWISSKLNLLAKEVAEKLDAYDIISSARKIEEFINDLSTWYLRRSRDRFRHGDMPALKTLRRVLFNLARIMAPFAPFTAEHVYQSLNECGIGKESVHLEDWPAPSDLSRAESREVEGKILNDMQTVREIVSSALESRAKAGIKIRQPLQKLEISAKGGSAFGGRNPKLKINQELLNLIKDEVNVKEIIFDENLKEEMKLDTVITDELKEEGMLRELIRQLQDIRKKEALKPNQSVNFHFMAERGAKDLLEKHAEKIKQLVNAEELIIGQGGDDKHTYEFVIDNMKFKASLNLEL